MGAAAGAPVIGEVWASGVFSGSARLQAQINPNGIASSYHVDFIAKAVFDANVSASRDPFTGTARLPAASEANIGAGSSVVATQQQPFGLTPATTYRYRVVAKNSAGTTTSATLVFATQATGGGPPLADFRGWEMVSPVDKAGGQIDPPGAIAGGGVLQAAADGQSVTYGSATSFGGAASGAPPASQYVSVRSVAGWSTRNISAPLYSGTYDTASAGVPYQLFSGDLARALLLNGHHCRGEATGCAVPNPPLIGTDAPAGYQNYYLREGESYTALLGAANAAQLTLEPANFELRLAGSSPDLRHAVLSTCAALTSSATEVPLGGGCDPAKANLYEYSPGAGLTLLNVLPAQTQGTPGATLAAQSGAISSGGSRVYWRNTASGNLYLRQGSTTRQVDATVGGGGAFEVASSDGSVAFFTKAGHLYRYEADGAGSSSDLTPSGDVTGVLGASADGARIYYLTSGGLFVWHGGDTSKVAADADPGNYPPATGTARVSAGGTQLLFVATAPLTGYDNKDLNTGGLDSQVYLYDDTSKSLTCISCNPTFGRPLGPSTVPGAIANGSAPGSTRSYKPRVLSVSGRRAFFVSLDALSLADTNNEQDVYQWEAQGTGSCTQAGGCVSLISSGKAEAGAVFVDASADGSDAFFLTERSLVGADAGGTDLYDARIGGGFPEPRVPIACVGDACQPLPSEPVDPTLTTSLIGPGNPAVRYPGTSKRCKKGYVKRKGKCVRKKARKAQRKGGKR